MKLKTLIPFLWLVPFLLWGGVACQPKTAVEEPQLELSTYEIQQSAEASTVTIQLRTNFPDWDAVSNVPWLSLRKNGTQLEIDVDENTTPKLRTAEITVLAGLYKKVKLTQAAAGGVFLAEKTAIDLDAVGGEREIYVKSNLDISVSSQNEWITAEYKPLRSLIQIEVQPNSDRVQRQGRILVSYGEKMQQIDVMQDAAPYFILPFLEFLDKEDRFKTFEKARHSTLVEHPDPMYDQQFWDYTVMSPLYTICRYRTDKGVLGDAYLFVKSKELYKQEEEGIKNSLIEAGFNEDLSAEPQEDKRMVFVNKAEYAIATIYPELDKPLIWFQPIPRQEVDYPSFKRLPKGGADYILSGLTEDIKAFEATQPSTINDQVSEPDRDTGPYYVWNIDNVGEDDMVVARIYWFNNFDAQLLREHMIIVDNLSFFFYEFLGRRQLTKEFIAVARQSGYEFVYHKDYPEAWIFYNESSKRRMVVGVERASWLLEGKEVAFIDYIAAETRPKPDSKLGRGANPRLPSREYSYSKTGWGK